MSALVRKTRRHPRGTVIGVLVTESIVTDAYRTYSLDATSVHDEDQRAGATDQVPRHDARLAFGIKGQHRVAAHGEPAFLQLLIGGPEPPDGERVGARLRVEHCGHPTANWPWDLRDPAGERHCYGAVISGDRNCGYAWRTPDEVFRYVEIMLSGGDPVLEFDVA